MSTPLVKRLTKQLSDNGVKNARGMAIAKLTQYGEIRNGKLTQKGKVKQELGAAGRAKVRAASVSKHPAKDFKYNPRTNRAKLK